MVNITKLFQNHTATKSGKKHSKAIFVLTNWMKILVATLFNL